MEVPAQGSCIALILGTGVDIVEIQRISDSLGRYGDKFSGRLLSGDEQALCRGVADQVLAQFVAGRFAVKEAVFKALGTGLGDARWTDVSVTRDWKGKPVAGLSGVAARRFAAMGGKYLHVSISHSKEYAVAQAIIEGQEPGGAED